MIAVWAARFHHQQIKELALLRLETGVSVCRIADDVWLCGEQLTPQIDTLLRRAVPQQRYRVAADGVLFPWDRRVPAGNLPAGPWTRMADFLVMGPQAAALPGTLGAHVRLTLAPGDVVEDPSVLLTNWTHWAAYACAAPAVRLKPLRFAAGPSSVVIRGRPVPPLPGERFVEHSGIAVPCGMIWSPAVDAAVLRGVLGLRGDDLALLAADGSWDYLPAESFVPARRSAVRLSLAAHDDC